MSLCYEWPMASGSACCVSGLDKHDQVHQTGATAWSLCPDVPECDLLLPQDATLGNISNYSIWTGFLHAVCHAITNGMLINWKFVLRITISFVFPSSALPLQPLHVLLSKP